MHVISNWPRASPSSNFEITKRDYSLNCTPLGPITVLLLIYCKVWNKINQNNDETLLVTVMYYNALQTFESVG